MVEMTTYQRWKYGLIIALLRFLRRARPTSIFLPVEPEEFLYFDIRNSNVKGRLK